MVRVADGIRAQNFDQEFNSRLFKSEASLIDYWCQTTYENKASLTEDQMTPSSHLFLLRQPITAPSSKLLLCLPQSWSPHVLTDSCLWGGDRRLTDPDVLIGRCQTKRHVANTFTHAHTHWRHKYIQAEADNIGLNISVNVPDVACECVCFFVSMLETHSTFTVCA